jgi:hypothetical protein
MTTDNSNPVQSRRAVYAAVALTDLPMPVRVAFDCNGAELRLVFDSIADCAAWARALDIDATTWRSDGEDLMHGMGIFTGRKVSLLGSQPVQAPTSEPLPTGTTRARLEQLTQEAA